jgi:hypothetical protein
MYKIVVNCLALLFLVSCKDSKDEYVAYFGGEIQNPTSKFILFCKGDTVLDTIFLKKDNTFYKKFDSLTPGLYNFKNEPEYQYVYFDKNDSLMIRLNANDFDNSLIFCGRGDQKNNFLMEFFLKNEKDKDKLFEAFNYDVAKYNTLISAIEKENQDFYNKKKEIVKWSDGFDEIAKASVNYSYYIKKEIYPFIHQMRTGEAVKDKLPKDFYKYRNDVNFNDKSIENFSPYIMFINFYINNKADDYAVNNDNSDQKMFTKSVRKLAIADSLLTNKTIKNSIINNIAYQFLQENKSYENSQKFIEKYKKLVPDSEARQAVLESSMNAGKILNGKRLTSVELVDYNDKKINSDQIFNKPTVICFWNSKMVSHYEAIHEKFQLLKKKFPQYQFVAINIDNFSADWKRVLDAKKYPLENEFHIADIELLHDKWAVGKVHRVIILTQNGIIKNGFSNLFEMNFEKELE